MKQRTYSVTAPTSARMTDEAFERIADRIECYDLLTVEARRARGREEMLDAALQDAPHKDSCRTGQDGPTGGCDCGKVAALEPKQ